MLRAFRKTVQRYWLEYFKEKEILFIDDIRYEHFDDYLLWRKTYWHNYEPSDFEDIRWRNNIKFNPASTTLKWEVNSLKAFLKWAKNHRYMFSDIPDYSMKGS